MNVVQICPYAWNRPGGVQTHVRGLSAELRRRGHRVHVIAPADGAVHDPEVTIVGRPLAIRYNGSVAPICPRPLALTRVARLVRTLQPDVVHVHEPFSPGLSMAATLAASAPVVATFHASARRLWTYRAFAPLLRVVQRRVHHSLAVSSAAAALLARDLGMPTEVLHNGIDDSRFTETPSLETPAVPTVLFVGRLEPRKGLRVLLAALPALRRLVPDVRVVIVGDGPERAAIAALPPALAAAVRHLGAVSDEQLSRCYAAASVFVAPSLSRESFGIVLLEAMAAGVPLVASDILGYRDVVRDGIDGCLVAPGRADALASTLAAVIGDRDGATARATRARGRARHFSWTRIGGAITALYDRARDADCEAGAALAPPVVRTPGRI